MGNARDRSFGGENAVTRNAPFEGVFDRMD